MLYPSPIRITLYPGTAQERRVLDWDEPLLAPVSLPFGQGVSLDTSIGAMFSSVRATGGADPVLDWEAANLRADASEATVEFLDNAAAAQAYLCGAKIEMANPLLSTAYPDAARCLVSWYAGDAVLESLDCGSPEAGECRTRGQLHVGAAQAVLAPALPTVIDLVHASAAAEHGGGIVRHDGLSWLRMRVEMPSEFTGNATAGWWDAAHARHITLEHSLDLATWNTGMCTGAPGVADVVADGQRFIWVESILPQDAEELTSDMRLTWKRPDYAVDWTYAQSLESLRIAGANVSLPHFPYVMPGDAALLANDLSDAGFTGVSVVTNDEDEVWEILLYDVPTSNYEHTPGGVVSPGHSYLNTFHEIAWSTMLRGQYLNPRFGPSLLPFAIFPRQFLRGRATRI